MLDSFEKKILKLWVLRSTPISMKKAKSMDQVIKKADAIKSVASRMAKLIEEILQFAKSSSGAPVPKESVSLNALLEGVKDNLRGAVLERACT